VLQTTKGISFNITDKKLLELFYNMYRICNQYIITVYKNLKLNRKCAFIIVRKRSYVELLGFRKEYHVCTYCKNTFIRKSLILMYICTIKDINKEGKRQVSEFTVLSRHLFGI